MTIDEQTITGWLFGADPVLGEKALDYFEVQGIAFQEKLFQQLPSNYQGRRRLALLTGRWGPEAAPFLAKAIEIDEYYKKVLAAECYADLPDTEEIRKPLWTLLHHQDFDIQRQAIEAVGYLGVSDWGEFIVEEATANSYSTQKLYSNAISALTHIVAKQKDRTFLFYDLARLEKFLEFLRNNQEKHYSYTELYRLFADLTPLCADLIAKQWLFHKDPFFRVRAAEAFEHLRLQRTAGLLGARFLDPNEDPDVRYQAGISLGLIGGESACDAIEQAINLPLDDRVEKAFKFAFAILISERNAWLEHKGLIDEILWDYSEAQMHLLYSIGILKAEKYLLVTKKILSGIEKEECGPTTRGAAMLSLARIEGSKAIPKLRKAELEAGEVLEKAFAQMALINAGQTNKTGDLHQTLCDFSNFSPPFSPGYGLRHFWKREILYALCQNAEEGRIQAEAWARIGKMNLEAVIDEMQQLLGENFHMPETVEPQPEIGVIQKIVPRAPEKANILAGDRIMDDEIRKLKSILISQSMEEHNGPKFYFRNMILSTNWPKDYKIHLTGDDSLKGDAQVIANMLVDFAIKRGKNPDKPDESVLTGLLNAINYGLLDLGSQEFIDNLRKKTGN